MGIRHSPHALTVMVAALGRRLRAGAAGGVEEDARELAVLLTDRIKKVGLLRFARAAVPLFGPGILRRWVGLAAVLAAAFAAALAAALAATFAAALNARLLGDVIGDRLETLIDGVELGLQPLLLRAVGRIADALSAAAASRVAVIASALAVSPARVTFHL